MRACGVTVLVLATGCRSLLGFDEPEIRAVDAPTDVGTDPSIDSSIDAGIDAAIDGGGFCYGVFHRFCFDSPPTSIFVVPSGTTMLDTSTETGCRIMSLGVGLGMACVIAHDTITIPTGGILLARGTLPLVLLARTSVTIDGTLDASSTVGVSGAGYNAPTCLSPSPASGPGGGAGGTLGASGGFGGGTGGAPTVVPSVTTLRGGCRGGSGGMGGSGGFGGGAVLLIGSTITINGTINASGAGGSGGSANISSAGGGGGGSGGMIVLDVQTLSLPSTSVLFANGGGGGEGAMMPEMGARGRDPNGLTALSPALGGTGNSSSGGDGGDGSTTGAGSNGLTSPVSSGGCGGGGGGAGVIRFTGGTVTSGGMISPPLS